MPATVAALAQIRPRIVHEALAYLDAIAQRAAAVPAYYPEHLKSVEPGRTAFDDIRQTVRVATDRKEFERGRAAEAERLALAGLAVGKTAYTPHWGVTEDDRR